MKKTLITILYTVIIIGSGWGILTLVVERTGPKKTWNFGEEFSNEKVLVVYDPDPFSNLDEKVSLTFAEVLASNGLNVKVVSVSAAKELEPMAFDVFVFCANTYNWGPDWALSNYLREQESLNNKPVIAITLGAGSTDRSKRKFEQLITVRKGKIIDSRSLWLLRPNDEARMKESNAQVALSIVRDWAKSIAEEIKKMQ